MEPNMSADLTAERFHNEEAARKFLEEVRWPSGPVCPHCGTVNEAYQNKAKPGVYRCAAKECRKDFSVTVGTLFERSHIPLHKWLLATHLMMASKKGVSAHQLHRTLGITYKSAWFMAHRIREALRPLSSPGPLGGKGKTVEADETYIGGKEGNKHQNKRKRVGGGTRGKEPAFTLVERGGQLRSFHLPEVTAKTLRPILVAQIDRASFLMTDEHSGYKIVGQEFAGHGSVRHYVGEYVRGDAHINTVENYFSILKRGITGVYHHVSQQHLKRYLAEFDFRYNERMALGVSDAERAAKALMGIEGKRLTYGGPQTR
jgi:transposase-like protein